jgi:hypothetical protein
MRRIAVFSLLSLLAACSQDSLGPDLTVVVGSFGAAADPVQLLATRVGVQLNLGCDGYFISRDPIRVDSAGSFHVRGKWYPDGGLSLGPPTDALLTGVRDAASSSVDVTLQVASDAPHVPVHYVLHVGTTFQGSLVCPQ